MIRFATALRLCIIDHYKNVLVLSRVLDYCATLPMCKVTFYILHSSKLGDFGPLHFVLCLIPKHMFELAWHHKMLLHLFQGAFVSWFTGLIYHSYVVLNFLFKFTEVYQNISKRKSMVSLRLSMYKHTDEADTSVLLSAVHINPCIETFGSFNTIKKKIKFNRWE